jgi:dihydrofolate synthase/folylpolyglutamate synthase
MDLETSLKKLFSLHTFGIKLGLENIIGFLNHLGNPQEKLKTLHVAGSNGKGSTSSFIASILQESGLKVGLYTSPHFVKFNERIVINGKQIDDEYVAAFVSENEKFIDEHQLTFFEVTTALAFKYFYEMKTDSCVIETGLGGRLDATNVLNALAAVITSISLEHTNVLGDTIQKIAEEKAAIIKNGANVFIGNLPKEAEVVVEKKCSETKSTLYRVKDFIYVNEIECNFKLDDKTLLKINPPLRGQYQKYNAALAALVVSKTFSIPDKENYLMGISNVSKNTGLQGRYEYFHKNPTIIFDSAHNPEGIENFLTEFQVKTNQFKKKTLLFGAMRDKAVGEMLTLLARYFDEIFLTTINYERAASLIELSEICDGINIKYNTVDKPVEFVRNFITKPKDKCLVVLGSMYLLGEIKTGLLT